MAKNHKQGLTQETLAHRFHLSAPVMQVLKNDKLATGFKHFISSLPFQIPELKDLSEKLRLLFDEVSNGVFETSSDSMSLTYQCFKDVEDVKLAYALLNGKKQSILDLNDRFIDTLQQYFETEDNTLYIKDFFFSVMFGLLQGVKIHNDEQPLDIQDFRDATALRTGNIVDNGKTGEIIELFPQDGKWSI